LGLLDETEKKELTNKYKKLVGNYKLFRERYLKVLGERNRLTKQLVTNADSGLPNAFVMHRQMNEILKKDNNPKVVCFIKLNEIFSLVRQTFSSKIAEWILYQTGVRIQGVVKKKGKVYHTKEDEFLIVFFDVSDSVNFNKILKILIKEVEEPHVLGGYNLSIRVNVGVAFYPRDGEVKSEILRNADIALNMAIKNHVPVFVFNSNLRMAQIERIEIQNGMLTALQSASDREKSQFSMVFQPQVELLDADTGKFRVVGAESLIRWKHPSLGFLSPGKFIPIAEDTGLIVPLGAWILRKSLQELAEWQTIGLSHLQMGINLSTRQFSQENIIDDIVKICSRLNIPFHSVKLEITEGTLMQNVSESSKKIEHLLNLGFNTMLDDFGTGYSSLSYLRMLAISIIKIDKSFVDGLPTDMSSVAPVRAIIEMGRQMKKGIIVEGVERWEQVRWLYDHGCRIFQGYYFSKPLSQEEFRKFALDHQG
jgi:EAL domain-containing protein (putative c-di-GMP-specific phosphodiesterase class I)